MKIQIENEVLTITTPSNNIFTIKTGIDTLRIYGLQNLESIDTEKPKAKISLKSVTQDYIEITMI